MVKHWRVKGTGKRFPGNIKWRRGPAVDFFLDGWMRLISFSKTRMNLICIDRDIPTYVCAITIRLFIVFSKKDKSESGQL